MIFYLKCPSKKQIIFSFVASTLTLHSSTALGSKQRVSCANGMLTEIFLYLLFLAWLTITKFLKLLNSLYTQLPTVSFLHLCLQFRELARMQSLENILLKEADYQCTILELRPNRLLSDAFSNMKKVHKADERLVLTIKRSTEKESVQPFME